MKRKIQKILFTNKNRFFSVDFQWVIFQFCYMFICLFKETKSLKFSVNSQQWGECPMRLKLDFFFFVGFESSKRALEETNL